MYSSSPPHDPADPGAVYLVPVTADGRILAVAERRPGRPAYWSLPSARRRHPRSEPGPVARRIAASLRLEYTRMRALSATYPSECLPAVYTALVAWTDRHPQYVAGGRHLLHALPADHDTLRTLDLRPAAILAVLLDDALDHTVLTPIGGRR
jgi:hypothetical protein